MARAQADKPLHTKQSVIMKVQGIRQRASTTIPYSTMEQVEEYLERLQTGGHVERLRSEGKTEKYDSVRFITDLTEVDTTNTDTGGTRTAPTTSPEAPNGEPQKDHRNQLNTVSRQRHDARNRWAAALEVNCEGWVRSMTWLAHEIGPSSETQQSTPPPWEKHGRHTGEDAEPSHAKQ